MSGVQKLEDQHKILRVHPLVPEKDIISKAAEIIMAGGVIAFPTRCLYGLGANALNHDAVNRIYDMKRRPKHKPILVLISRLTDLERFVTHIPQISLPIIEKFWPGKITLIFNAKPNLPVGLTAGTGKIGIRLCEHPVAVAIVEAAGTPITGTSANISGNVGCSDISTLEPELVAQLDLILDAGPLLGGAGSTIVDVTGNFPVIVREGIVPSHCLNFDLPDKG